MTPTKILKTAFQNNKQNLLREYRARAVSRKKNDLLTIFFVVTFVKLC